MSTLDRALSRRIRQARHHAGLSVVDFAALLGVGLRIVAYWERGEKTPTLTNLCKIAVYCDVTLAFLLFEVDEKREQIAREG